MSTENDRSSWRGVRPITGSDDFPVTLGQETLVLGMPTGATPVGYWNSSYGSLQTVWTVSAGKTLYLCNATLAISNKSGSNSIAEIRVYNTVPAIVYYLNAAMVYVDEFQVIPMQFTPPMPIPAGYTIKVITDVMYCRALATIYGYEV